MTVFLVLWTVSLYFFFLCEQKTAYEMRISDWSSDVCSSDLAGAVAARHPAGRIRRRFPDVALSHRRHQHRRPEGTPAAAPPAGDGCPAGRGGTQPQRSAGRGRTRRRYVPDSARRVNGGSSEGPARSEEHTSELQSLMRISYAVFCLKKKKNTAEARSQ